MRCTGCGLPLPSGSGRGRPARYHNAACRQRARRARLVKRHTDVLAAVATVETSAVEARQAVLSGGNVEEAALQLTRAATDLARLLAPTPVTRTDAVPVSPPPIVTKPVTESEPDERPRTRPLRPEPLDLDTVRLERSSDSSRMGWRVLAGADDAPVLVGFLEPVLSVTGRRSSRWEAQAPTGSRIYGGPWRTRTDALVRLVDDHQRAASAPRGRTIT